MAVRGFTSFQAGGVNNILSLTGIADGNWAFIIIESVNAAGAIPTPEGWTLLKARETFGTRQAILFGKIWHTGDPTNVTIAVAVDGVKAVGAVWGDEGPTTIDQLVIGASRLRSTIGTAGARYNNIAPSITVAANTRVMVFSVEATAATESPNSIASVDNGMTEVMYQGQPSSSFIETIWVGSKVISEAGASGDTTITYRNPQDNNGWAVQVGIPQVAVVPPDPGPGFDNVYEMLRTSGVTWAHRGGSANWPEMSEYAYDQAVLAGYDALEFSAHRTSDGIWIGSHDPSLNRTSQTSGLPNISTMTWAQVQTYMNSLNSAGTPRPYYRLDAFLDKYTPERVCIADPKTDVGQITNFLNLLDAHGGPSKIIVKFFGVGTGATALADAARLRGYQTWGYFYETDFTSGDMARDQSHWSILGMDIGASQAAWDAVMSYGKPVVGHIAQSQANYNTAISRGARMVQCANVTGIAAVGQQDLDHLVEYNGTDLTQVELVEWDGTYLKAIQIVEKK